MRCLSGPRLIPIKANVDERGFLYQVYGTYPDDFPSVKRIYVVGNFAKGVVRGFHLHWNESKAYFTLKGTAKFVVVDKDKKISTYVLSDRDPLVLVIPPGYSHGWVALEEQTLLIGISDRSLKESQADDIRSDPFEFGKDIWKGKSH